MSADRALLAELAGWQKEEEAIPAWWSPRPSPRSVPPPYRRGEITIATVTIFRYHREETPECVCATCAKVRARIAGDAAKAGGGL